MNEKNIPEIQHQEKWLNKSLILALKLLGSYVGLKWILNESFIVHNWWRNSARSFHRLLESTKTEFYSILKKTKLKDYPKAMVLNPFCGCDPFLRMNDDVLRPQLPSVWDYTLSGMVRFG